MEKIKQVKLSPEQLEERKSELYPYVSKINDESIFRRIDHGNDTFVFVSKEAKIENEAGEPKYVIKLWENRGMSKLPERYKAITDQAISRLAELKISNPFFFRPGSTAALIEINPILKIKKTLKKISEDEYITKNAYTISPYISGKSLRDYKNDDIKKIRINNILKKLYSPELFPFLQEFMIPPMIDELNIKVQEDENGNVVKVIITDLFASVSDSVGLIEYLSNNSQL